jgi:hypothetical protein
MQRTKSGTARIRGGAATPYGAGRGHIDPKFGRKEAGIKVAKGHGGSKRQRKIASGRM